MCVPFISFRVRKEGKVSMIKTIGFLGCGNMGGAIARAVCKAADPQNVYLANRTAAKAEALRMQQSYVAFKTLYWRAIAEGHEDEAERVLEENKDIIDTVKRQQHAKVGS